MAGVNRSNSDTSARATARTAVMTAATARPRASGGSDSVAGAISPNPASRVPTRVTLVTTCLALSFIRAKDLSGARSAAAACQKRSDAVTRTAACAAGGCAAGGGFPVVMVRAPVLGSDGAGTRHRMLGPSAGAGHDHPELLRFLRAERRGDLQFQFLVHQVGEVLIVLGASEAVRSGGLHRRCLPVSRGLI